MQATRRVLVAAAGLAAASCMAGCGFGVVPVPASPLNGNWNVVGTGQPTSFPSLSFSLVAVGDQLYANGSMAFRCNSPSGIGGGGTIRLAGQIASDGSFQLTEPNGYAVSLNGSPIEVTVNGSVPLTASANWSGSYSIANAAGTTGCVTDETGTFKAVPYAPVDGTYSGPLVMDNTGSTGVSMSISVTQQGPTEAPLPVGVQNPLGINYYLPLTGTISVSGIPCFTQGVSSAGIPGEVNGSIVVMNFRMNDGSLLLVAGTLPTTQSTSIEVRPVAVTGGQCAGSYAGILNKQ